MRLIKMKLLKGIITGLLLIYLTGCGVDNNTPVVEERPFETVSLEEALPYLQSVVDKDNLRHFLKETVYLDFEELDNITEDFIVGDITLENTSLNTFKVSFFHTFSNYEIVVELSLDKESEAFVIYNTKVSESTYVYTDPMFSEMHSVNIVSYLNDDTRETDEICQRFDTTNTYCETYLKSVRATQSTLSIFNSISYDDYFILSIQSTNEWIHSPASHTSTEVSIGINDEGSFIYDMSFLREHTSDSSVTKFRTNIFQMLDDLDEGKTTYSEACSQYFYGDYDCLKSLTQFNLDDRNVIYTRTFGVENKFLEDSYYRLVVDYSPTYSFVINMIDYYIYETENGHIFFNEITSFDSTQLAKNENNPTLQSLIKNMYNDVNDDDFCDRYNNNLYNCEETKSSISFNEFTVEVSDISPIGESFTATIRFTDVASGDYIILDTQFNLARTVYDLSKLTEINNANVNYFLGFERSKAIFKQLYLDLGDADITFEEIYNTYSILYNGLYVHIREQYIALDMELFMSEWKYETIEIDGVDMIKLTTLPYDSSGGEAIEIIFSIETRNDNYIINLYEDVTTLFITDIDNSNTYVNIMINNLRNPNLSNEESCHTFYANDYSSCETTRNLLKDENHDVIVDTYVTEFPFVSGQMAIYDKTTNRVISFILFRITEIATFTKDTLIIYNLEIGNADYFNANANNVVSDFLLEYWDEDVSNIDFCTEYDNPDVCISQRELLLAANTITPGQIHYQPEISYTYFTITYTNDDDITNIQYFELVPLVENDTIYYKIVFIEPMLFGEE